MSKLTSIVAAAALLGSTSLAFADGPTPPLGQPNDISATHVTCHHDGDIIQGPNGLLQCHMRPPNDTVHFKSPGWFAAINARASGTNN